MRSIIILPLALGFLGPGAASSGELPQSRSETASLSATVAANTAAQTDFEMMEGKWELMAYQGSGVNARKPSCIYVFKDATLIVYPEGRPRSCYTLKIDASSDPKKMDIIATWPDGRIQKAEAIYRITKNQFYWYAGAEGKRPKEFPSDPAERGYVFLRKLVEH